MVMENLGSRIKKLRVEKRLSQQKLADLIGVSKTSIIYWEKDENIPKHDSLLALARELDTSVDYLTKGIEEDQKNKDSKPSYKLESAHVWSDGDPLDDGEIEVPYYKEVLLSTGHGTSYSVEQEGVCKLRYDLRMLKENGIEPNSIACATNYGDSMEKVIQDGSKVAIDRSKRTIKDGKIYAFDHGGLLKVKYLYKRPNGAVLIRSENQVDNPDETLSAEVFERDVEIIGWVFDWSKIQKW